MPDLETYKVAHLDQTAWLARKFGKLRDEAKGTCFGFIIGWLTAIAGDGAQVPAGRVHGLQKAIGTVVDVQQMHSAVAKSLGGTGWTGVQTLFKQELDKYGFRVAAIWPTDGKYYRISNKDRLSELANVLNHAGMLGKLFVVSLAFSDGGKHIICGQVANAMVADASSPTGRTGKLIKLFDPNRGELWATDDANGLLDALYQSYIDHWEYIEGFGICMVAVKSS